MLYIEYRPSGNTCLATIFAQVSTATLHKHSVVTHNPAFLWYNHTAQLHYISSRHWLQQGDAAARCVQLHWAQGVLPELEHGQNGYDARCKGMVLLCTQWAITQNYALRQILARCEELWMLWQSPSNDAKVPGLWPCALLQQRLPEGWLASP